MSVTPTVDRIRGRLRVRIDGTPAAAVRARYPDGRKARYGSRRNRVVAMALQWQALGYEDVEVSLPAKGRDGLLDRDPIYREFPATREEAVEAVRELAAQRAIGSGRWRRILRRIEDPYTSDDYRRDRAARERRAAR